ncbi:hypothetical protein SO802_032520 [Lithocarpus litseifolius]|uniref:PPM-type phosphatase domain-containing protein n=1 Tax=Lithocarpus litseifolius TaxID=425828 RepID=A0AAW2BFW4_9ROSI
MSRMMANDEGGLSERSEWDLSTGSLQNKSVNCQFATFQGHREYQEDRIVCDLDMKIPHLGNLTASLSATELTEDHSPGRDDERARIEAAGGIIVTLWGKPWVNSELPLSRAIGDVYQKRFGVIAEPEVTGWKTLDANDRFLVVSSDGIFESMTPQDFSIDESNFNLAPPSSPPPMIFMEEEEEEDEEDVYDNYDGAILFIDYIWWKDILESNPSLRTKIEMRNHTNSNGTTLSSDLTRHSMRLTDLVTPVSSPDRNDRELSQNDSTTNSSSNLLAALDTEPDMAIVVTDDDEGLEASSLTGTSLFLHGHDLHGLVFETKVELVHNLVLDWE